MPVQAYATGEGQTTIGDIDCDTTSDDCHALPAELQPRHFTMPGTEPTGGRRRGW
jgi:hypothetical protein